MATMTPELKRKIKDFTGDPEQIDGIVRDLVESMVRKGKRGRKPHVTPEQWALWSNGEIHTLVQGIDFDKPIPTMRSILAYRVPAGFKLRTCVIDDAIRIQVLPKGEMFTLIRTSPPGRFPSQLESRRPILEAFARGDLTMEEACAQCGGFSKQRLYALVQEAGIELDRGSVFDLLEPEDLERFSRGEVSVQALAAKMGVGYSYALKVLNSNGVNNPIRARQVGQVGRPQFVLPDEDVRLFLDRGITLDQLAVKHKVHKMTVVSALRRQGGVRNPRANRFTLTQSECDVLRAGRCTIGEVAEQRGVNYMTVRYAMVNQGVLLPRPSDTL